MTIKNKLIEDLTILSEHILLGKTLLYPTDTIWGIGCDATNSVAVDRIFKIKERAESKSVVILMENIEMIEYFTGKLPQSIVEVITTTERPTTFILKNHHSFLPTKVVSSENTVAIRIPKHHFCLALLNKIQRPLVSSSANISGTFYPKKYAEIEEVIKNRVDYIASQIYDTSIVTQPSRIVRFENEKMILLRP